MKLCKKLLSIAGITFGGIGMLVCIAMIVLLWITSARLGQKAATLFDKTDRSLVLIQQRVVQVQERVAAAAITAEELEKSFRDWTKQAAVRKIVSQAEISERAKGLASTLQEAEQWLEISEASVGIIQNLLSMRDEAKTPTDTGSVDRVMEEIASLRTQLVKATEVVVTIRGYIDEISGEKPREERLLQGAKLALRVAATLGSARTRFEKLEQRLSESQSQVQSLKVQTRRWFLIATIGITLLIIWMGAGQLALGLLAWKCWR